MVHFCVITVYLNKRIEYTSGILIAITEKNKLYLDPLCLYACIHCLMAIFAHSVSSKSKKKQKQT